MNKQTARIYFVMDSKSDKPRMRIEDGAIYPDGTWHSWCEREYMLPDSFIDVCAEYAKNRSEV